MRAMPTSGPSRTSYAASATTDGDPSPPLILGPQFLDEKPSPGMLMGDLACWFPEGSAHARDHT
jgi:hypothetical protein